MYIRKRISALLSRHLHRHPLHTANDFYELLTFDSGAEVDYYFCNERQFNEAYINISFVFRPRLVHINNIYVQYGQRGNGFGASLVNIVEVMAADFNAKRVIAKESINNSFWRHMRYQKVYGTAYDFEKLIFF